MPDTARTIDLNCDLGEGLGDDADRMLMDIVTSANIACGGHAGDEATMRAAVRAALSRTVPVGIGAHPGYPDRARFGRDELAMDAAALEHSVFQQVSSLRRVAVELGGTIGHVKPHGALYHACAAREPVARAFGAAVLHATPDAVVIGPFAGAAGCLELWRTMGLRAVAEAFADRSYEPDGTLRSRALAGSLVPGPGAAAAQALSIVRDARVRAVDGSWVLTPGIETICVHGDTPGAVAIAQAVRDTLEAAGCRLRSLRATNSIA